ncbi:N-acetyltransferase [Butyrivibrio sp. CB08]|uniref:GNAT family N-acetyltransferase n=1 Tax=Butyrivibrio sp. CB08 TaxID=2364879 RepID=UPI000EAA341B|nr:GNAT family protein [Butyrivibrio sp. CB08]RKM55360.1 N-acetyltransferase [Butyrivibrio sp. CB08]
MLRLRPFRKNDAKAIITWTRTPEEFYKWSAGILGDFPLTEDRMIESTSGRDDSERFFPFTAFDESGPVGYLILRIPGEDDKRVRFGFVIVSPEMRGKGYGKQLLKLALNYAFDVYGAEAAELGVFSNNPNAYHCYKSVGFKETGKRKDYEILGETWTDVEMEYDPGEENS